MTHLANNVVWVTGASSGIGEELAAQLSAEGAHIVLSARREAELQRVAKERCSRASSTLVVPLDMADAASLATAHAKVIAHYGHVDVLVNNAGVSQRARAIETPVSVIRTLMDVDFFGPVSLTQLVLPGMVARKSGHVVVVTSMVGVFGTPLRSGYSAAKHALHGYFESLRAEHAVDGVQVLIACPGFVRTGISAHALTSDGTALGTDDRKTKNGISVEQCARGMVRAIKRNAIEVYVAGTQEKLAGWLKRASPTMFARVIRRVAVT
ncbi:MAG: SDR family oxidoreductase [Clostridia bacterium]|nr:SDR family oxidoreductase [Deltaproteobacteria bacterium]